MLFVHGEGEPSEMAVGTTELLPEAKRISKGKEPCRER